MIQTGEERLAYLAVRMPATFAAISQALRAARQQLASPEVESLLDLGAGPGTSGWAAVEIFPSIRRVRFVESDAALINLGRQLCDAAESEGLRSADWAQVDMTAKFPEESFDLVIASYSLGELPPPQRIRCLQQAWARTRKLLVIIEPGTPQGFRCIDAMRAELIRLEANLVAPCPHRHECPLAAAGDWCHFAARLERTAAHRRIKRGSLGHEDEKFSYVAASPLKVTAAAMRIIRHPGFHPGYVELQLCAAQGLLKRRIGKSRKVEYRAARKSEWGGAWTPVSDENHPNEADE